MRVAEIVQELEDRGASITPDGSQLHITFKKGAVPADLVEQAKQNKTEILRFLGQRSPLPSRGCPSPSPSDIGDGFDLGRIRIRFAEHGCLPAWDDLICAARLERQCLWCRETLEAVYRGEMTLFFTPDGSVAAAGRTIPC
jgi:hypothetical protein